MSTTEVHKEVVRSYYDKLWNDQDFDLVSDILAADITFRGLTDLSRLQRVKVGSGREGFAAYVKTMHSFLSNYNIEVEDMVAEGNKVFCRTVVCGVHRGQFISLFGIAQLENRVLQPPQKYVTSLNALVLGVGDRSRVTLGSTWFDLGRSGWVVKVLLPDTNRLFHV
eukprot:CAMPEP_0197733930 /NCGR_PEP_ID=MMETSP1434-20131217/44159_1 /TAXON_ID=265543 /ORGANISM="Minutocellus polymorphus, Strain CCMP3303" /LENGTH=166 /DNA_ID=CAMNT_0043321329 /DNA_START=57 /DNA_END=557 /DNA_ORIENTATION=+